MMTGHDGDNCQGRGRVIVPSGFTPIIKMIHNMSVKNLIKKEKILRQIGSKSPIFACKTWQNRLWYTKALLSA
jgi:hypothetical protein